MLVECLQNIFCALLAFLCTSSKDFNKCFFTPMSKRNVFFIHMPLIFTAFAVYTTQNILLRMHRHVSEKSGTLISIYCAAVIMTISFFIQRGNSRGIIVPTSIVVALFFVSIQLHIAFSPSLSAMCTTICMQPRLIAIYVFSVFFMKNRLRLSNIFGITLIIISLLLLSRGKQAKAKRNPPYACISVAFASVCSGSAFFIFDYKVREKISCPHAYITVAQSLTLLLAVAFLLGKRIFLGKWEDFSALKTTEFHMIAASYTMFAYCTFAMSFLFKLIPRILTSILIHTSSDIIAEWWIEGGFTADVLCRYVLCVVGVIVYQYSSIRAHLIKNQTGIPRKFEAHGNKSSKASHACSVTSDDIRVE